MQLQLQFWTWQREKKSRKAIIVFGKGKFKALKSCIIRAVVVVVDLLLLTPEVLGWNKAIGKFYIVHLLTVNSIQKIKTKKKEAGNGPFKKEL